MVNVRTAQMRKGSEVGCGLDEEVDKYLAFAINSLTCFSTQQLFSPRPPPSQQQPALPEALRERGTKRTPRF